MAQKTTKKPVKKSSRNPSLHGLVVARTLSGTVVRTLLFVVLTGALVLAATLNIEEGRLGALAMLALMGAVYLLFDVLYVLLANIRPFHPRIDRVALPVALVLSLIAVYSPLILISNANTNIIGIWLTGGIVLIFILGVRFALTIASSKR